MKFLLILALCALPVMSAPRWVRRATLAAACAASAADAATTYEGKLAGMQENNPLFRASNGTPAMGRVISLKVGICVVQGWLQEHRNHNDSFIVGNVSQAALFFWATWHNIDVLNRERNIP
jgi:hypothetical protein